MNTDRLRGYCHGVRDKRVPDGHPHRRPLPIDHFVGRAVDDLHRAADEIDRIRDSIARHAARSIDSGRDVHQHDRDLWRLAGPDAIDAVREGEA